VARRDPPQAPQTAASRPPGADAQRALAPVSSEPVQVSTARPSVESLHRVTRQPAHVEPYERTSVYAKASGYVRRVLVDLGDRVEQDQPLAELWIPEMEQQQAQKAALVEQAQAAVRQAEARRASADALVAAAAAKLEMAQASIAQFEAELAYRTSEHARIRELVRGKAVSAVLEDEKLKQLRAAEAALSAAQAGVRSAEADLAVERARRTQAQADITQAEAQLRVAEADLRHAQILLDYSRVRAPYAGLVSRRWVDTGDFIASAAGGQSEPLFTLDRVDRLRITLDVPEADSALVKIGQPASLAVDALKGRTYEGQVQRSAGVLDPKTRTLHVEIEVEDPKGELRAGMYGMASLTLAERQQALLLPTRCLRYDAGRPFVLCVRQGTVERAGVETGYSDGIRTEIVAGLEPDDAVIVESRVALRPGQPVTAAPFR
jgi:RND family efflux transporter MFP subunit